MDGMDYMSLRLTLMPEQKRAPQITDPTGLAVAANVRRHRERQGLSTYELARRLADAGRPMTPAAVGRIERGERRVDVGDLMALAAALDVPPVTLLLPARLRGDVEITGVGTVSSQQVLRWSQAREPLRYPTDAVDEESRARFLAMWLMTSAPGGRGFDMTTSEGQRALIEALKEGAWGTETSGDEGG